MPRTDRVHGGGPRRGLRPFGAAVLAALLALAPPLAAQQAATTEAITADEVLELSDHGLDLAEAGDMDTAYTVLHRANLTTIEHDYPVLVSHYPNLAFARYHYMTGNWSEVERYASSVASALDSPEHDNHPWRIEATIFHGIAAWERNRAGEAEVLLRGAMADAGADPDMRDLEELAHYFLALAATRNEATDASALRESFLARATALELVTPAQALQVLNLSLQAAIAADEEPEQLVTLSEQLIGLADTVEGVDPFYRSYYRGNHGKLLYNLRRYDEALPFFEERDAFLRENDTINADIAINAVWLANALTRSRGTEEGEAFLLPLAEGFRADNRIPSWAMADIEAQLGFYARWLDDESLAQERFRRAYATVRRDARVTDARVAQIAALVDPADPGVAGWAFAGEFGAEADDLPLSPDGVEVIRRFLSGDWLSLETRLDAYRTAGRDRSPEYLVNLALYQAMVGRYEAAQTSLDEARRKARTTLGSDISANAPIFDFVDLISKVWGTTHLADRADGAIARLQAREATLPQEQLSLYLALRALSRYQSGADEGIRADIQRWLDAQPATAPDAPLGVIDQFAASIMVEMLYTYMGPEVAEGWMEAILPRFAASEPLSLAVDSLRLARVVYAPSLAFSDRSLPEMSALVAGLLDQVPQDHSLAAAAQFNVSNAFTTRNRPEEALRWMRAATESWRRNPYHRKDTLAYLVSQQAWLMNLLGETSVAATLAKEAYDMIDPLTARSDLATGVIQTYAWALSARSNQQRGGEIFRRHIEDAAFMRRLKPMDRVRFHAAYADTLVNYGELPEILEQLDLALAAVPEEGVFDWRSDISAITFTRAIANYWNGRMPEAWADMTRSNDVKAEWRRDTISDGEGEALNAQDIGRRAVWEAIMGWDYARTLPE